MKKNLYLFQNENRKKRSNRYIKNLKRRATIDARLKKVLEKRIDTDYKLYGDE